MDTPKKYGSSHLKNLHFELNYVAFAFLMIKLDFSETKTVE